MLSPHPHTIHNFTPAPPGWTAHCKPHPPHATHHTHTPIAGWITWTEHDPTGDMTHITAGTVNDLGDIHPVAEYDNFCCITGPGEPPHESNQP